MQLFLNPVPLVGGKHVRVLLVHQDRYVFKRLNKVKPTPYDIGSLYTKKFPHWAGFIKVLLVDSGQAFHASVDALKVDVSAILFRLNQQNCRRHLEMKNKENVKVKVE